jgi:hypothetical protein
MRVFWLYKDKKLRGTQWDQGLLEDLLKGQYHIESKRITPSDEAIVILPARYYVDEVDWLNREINKVDKLKLILTSDEESLFPIEKLDHPNIKLYVMTPDFKHDYPEGTIFLGEGYPPHMKLHLSPPAKTLDYFFSGQITHERRQLLAKAQETIVEFKDNNQLNGKFNETPGFTQGYEPQEYYELMMSAKAVPCPSGPATPDSFRVFEALECGAVPVCDNISPAGVDNYWARLYSESPLPSFDNYDFVQSELINVRDEYPVKNNDCLAWWMRYKRDLKLDLVGTQESITVLVPTSPIGSNPDTSIINETIESVRTHLPTAEIILMFDGVRSEQEEMRADYNEYIRQVLWLANHKWKNIYPIIFKEHQHQALMTKEALKHVNTDLVLFVEHDTPIAPDRVIEWEGIVNCIKEGEANLVRLCHEELILPDYKHMTLDEEPLKVGSKLIPMVRTVQWSQRPHVASTAFYKTFLDLFFDNDKRTMIEDKMHSVVHSAYLEGGVMAWNLWKIWIYHPDTDALGIKRSYHLDGRGSASKYEETFV